MVNYLCNVESDEILNKRIFSRNIGSHIYLPAYDPRPQETKYVRKPTVNGDIKGQENKNNFIIWNTETTFFPNVGKAPWLGYVSSINKENKLRNQTTPLSRNSEDTYIPNQNSDLYVNSYSYDSGTTPETYKTTTNPTASKCILDGNKTVFNNYTRWEIR